MGVSLNASYLEQGGWRHAVMPLRAELREAGRLDLEKAVAAQGGFAEVANALGWKLAYKTKKPRG